METVRIIQWWSVIKRDNFEKQIISELYSLDVF